MCQSSLSFFCAAVCWGRYIFCVNQSMCQHNGVSLSFICRSTNVSVFHASQLSDVYQYIFWMQVRPVLTVLYIYIYTEDARQLKKINCGNCMVCRIERYCIVRHCTNDPRSLSAKLQSTRTVSSLPFAPTHSAIWPPPPRPRTPISSRCVLCSSARFLVVCSNGSWTVGIL